ncbi:hypothetical protein [Escherichia phage dw-ec]|nr:hypothetical protein [Escherichia phage BI-EHEC]UJQ43789.1 hypothetical protein [Escherichia phage dw-ec]
MSLQYLIKLMPFFGETFVEMCWRWSQTTRLRRFYGRVRISNKF